MPLCHPACYLYFISSATSPSVADASLPSALHLFNCAQRPFRRAPAPHVMRACKCFYFSRDTVGKVPGLAPPEVCHTVLGC